MLDLLLDTPTPPQLPEDKLFEHHWANVLARTPEAANYRDMVRVWFHWGYSDAKFRRTVDEIKAAYEGLK